MAELPSLVIFGAGGFAREVLELVRDINAARPRYDLIGLLDDRETIWGSELNGLPVLGGESWLARQSRPPLIVFGVGSPPLKLRLAKRLRPLVAGFPVLVHPTVVRSRFVECGEGVVITAGNILTTNITLSDFVMLNLMCTVGHDATLGRYTTVSPGVNVSGNVLVGEGCDLGTGAKIVQGVSIGEWSIVGAGAVVARSLPANCTAVGVPAKPVKQRESGWHLA